ncbi:MAG TPA: T9SS type A sorting domain-containing protein, partial [Chitinophagaceae bacterium]|nr:T9SS type A sorting domain-containing protein [Chitinophagaceae bacterium]
LVLLSVISYSSAKSVVQTSCPFVEGLAVYKARTLWALWEPSAVFDDRGLCAQGQSKNQDNINIDEFMINSLKDLTSTKTNRVVETSKAILKEKHTLLSEDLKIKVYPNPASEYILIEYDCENDGVFLLYNSIGQQILNTQLGKGRRKVQIAIKDISNGMYQYKCTLNGCVESVGKLSVQH